MPLSPTEEIKERLDIADVVRDYVKLEKAGANLRAICPFHSERSPSFFVSPVRQTWHCFGGCGEGGDIFTFIMKIEGVEFRDALHMLAERAGVQLPSRGPEVERTESQRKRLSDLVELASQFFEKQLASSEDALLYLASRKVSKEGIAKWRIGYAPLAKRALLDFLLTRGFTEREAMSAGLGVRTEQGVLDRFRGRIIFPVCDTQSRVLGFGGRLLREAEGMAKYLNCPNTILYDKSRALYGLDKAKVAIRRQDALVLVEGYMDVILVFESGFENVVASSGTALTPSQLRILKRYTDNLILAFDMDTAGDTATRRGIDLALEQGFHVKVVEMPKGTDPADVASSSSEEWGERVKTASSILAFYLSSALSRFDKNSPEGKGKIAGEVLGSVKLIP
ncbi:MAG: DNA primase, partial [Candidatus Pacearchaeota archaeon]|nr:DNA primase [Candidatus Pacearchaeota archaeon]